MLVLLYVKASPRAGRSYSVRVAEAFLKAYKVHNAGDEIDELSLFATALPAFDGPALQAKYEILSGRSPTEDQKAAWAEIEQHIARFTKADKYLFAVPMWNFGLPYRLKQYLDVLIQPGYTFSFDPEAGYQGLVTGKPCVVVFSRGGQYAEGTPTAPFDFQKPYFEHVLRFIGFTDIRSIVVEPTLAGGPQAAQDRLAAAVTEAQELAGRL